MKTNRLNTIEGMMVVSSICVILLSVAFLISAHSIAVLEHAGMIDAPYKRTLPVSHDVCGHMWSSQDLGIDAYITEESFPTLLPGESYQIDCMPEETK